MPATARASGTPASISDSEAPQTVAIDDEPFELGDLRDDADGVGEVRLGRQDRMDRAPRQLAVTDLAAAGKAEAAGLADRVRREIVVQHEVLAVLAGERVDDLLVLPGAERGDHQRLGLAAGEQRAAVRPGQQPHLHLDRPDRPRVAAVDTGALGQDAPPDDVLLEVLEDLVETLEDQHLVERLVVRQRRLDALLDRGDLVAPGGLSRLAVGFGQLGIGDLAPRGRPVLRARPASSAARAAPWRRLRPAR